MREANSESATRSGLAYRTPAVFTLPSVLEIVFSLAWLGSDHLLMVARLKIVRE